MWLFILASIFWAVSCEDQSEKTLPTCKHIDAYKDLKGWLNYEQKDCNHTTVEEELSRDEKILYDFGLKSFAFDVMTSDRMGPARKIGYQAHELCKKQNWDAKFSVSIVIVHHNEALSVLLRMLIGLFENTPAELLKEIIVYDDASEGEHRLDKYLEEFKQIKGYDKLKIFRNPERQGLIRAKVLASREASGEILVFLDSHCEVAENWLPPLLQPIKENPKTVTVPVADLINPAHFEYSKSMIARSGFDWSLSFKWDYVPWDHFDVEENNYKPIESPGMPGGLMAVRADFFKELGEYDTGLEIWGGENVELSLKTWMCGGRVLVIPCSRVGHVFRMRRPYNSKSKVAGGATQLYNSVRVAKVWLDEESLNKFFKARPRAKNIDVGDLSERLKIKETLKCKDMAWYIENVYPALKPKVRDEL
ncbi:hypothetical protein WR25_04660 [Diploscapter pachys]|uniref:Glycosyltransferase 2-like domain-containing protein n=1 Tax=Diploscapter pachys TaxID=2018661 RepID=A0A2A2KHU9_9BILA|nr:hypothetical protein WR25_04660 [Diploscapter pachys]